MHLTVIHPFSMAAVRDEDGKELEPARDYARGEKINDKAEIDEILKGENAGHVVRTADPRDGPNGTPVTLSPKKSN